MATARAAFPKSSYWEQFYAAFSCKAGEESEAWMEREVVRYRAEFGFDETDAWRTIACNLAFFAAYHGSGAVLIMRNNFGVFPECFDAPDFHQDKRRSMSESGKSAADSPV